jgi:hypothetical protein
MAKATMVAYLPSSASDSSPPNTGVKYASADVTRNMDVASCSDRPSEMKYVDRMERIA